MPRKRLTEDQRGEIIRLYTSKTTRQDWTVPRLVSAFGVSRSTINNIVKDLAPGRHYMGMDRTGRVNDSTAPWMDY